MRIRLKQLIPSLSLKQWAIHISEMAFWIALALAIVLRCRWRAHFGAQEPLFTDSGLKIPLLLLILTFAIHAASARSNLFSLAGSLVRWLARFLEQLNQPLRGVHWSLKLATLLVLLWMGLIELPKRSIPGPTRLMLSQQNHKKVLRWEGQDRNIDFRPPDLRRPLYQADRVDVTWQGYLFAPRTGQYKMALEADGIHNLQIGNREVLSATADWQVIRTVGEVNLSYGSHPFEIHYSDIAFQSTMRLLWQPPKGEWEPVPEYCLSRSWIDPGQQRSMERRVRFRPVVILLALALIWHFLTIGFQRWQNLSTHQQKRLSRWLLAAIMLGGFALRLQFLIRTQAMTHADEGMVALMAKHIAAGKAFPLIYYDQVYNGTLFSYLLAPLYAISPFPFWNLKIYTCLLSVLAIYLVYRLGSRWFSLEAGLIGAFIAALAPVMCVIYGLMALVGPIEGVVMGLLIFWIATPVIFSGRCSGWRAFCFGLVCGLSVWVNFQIFYFLLPLGLFWLLRGKPLLRKIPQLVTGGVLGMVPLLVYNFTHHFATFHRFLDSGGESKNLWELFEVHLLGIGLPHLLGSRVRWDMYRSFTPDPLPLIVGVLATLIMVGLIAVTLKHLFQRNKTGTNLIRPESFLLVMVGGVLLLYLGSNYGEHQPRYLFSLFPVLCLLIGWWIARSLTIAPALAALLLLPFTVQNAVGNGKVDPFYFSQPVHYVERGTLLPERSRELIGFLEKEGITRLHCDYWIAYSLALESGETIQSDCDRDRYRPYRDVFLASTRPAYLYHNHDVSIELYSNIFEFELGYKRKEILPYILFYPQKDLVPRSEWQVESSDNTSLAFLAIDGDLTPDSRWHCTIKKSAGWLEIDLGREVEIEKILVVNSIEIGGPFIDQGLSGAQLQLSRDGLEWTDGPEAKRGYFNCQDHFAFKSQRVRYIRIINQPRQYPQDWSVYDIFIQ